MPVQNLVPTVRVGYAAVVVEYLLDQGLDAAAVLGPEWAGFPGQRDLGGRIAVDRYADLMKRAIAFTGDPALPIRLASRILPRHLGILGATILHCANLGEAALLLQRYERLIDDINDARFEMTADRASVEWISRLPDTPSFFMQKSMAVWVAFARRISGCQDLVADVDFLFPEPGDVAPYRDFFRGRVRFAQPHAMISFNAKYLALPLQLHEPQSHDLLLQRLHQQFEDEFSESSLTDQVRREIRRLLSQGRASLDGVAQSLSMSSRTLQNHLLANGCRFRDLLETERFHMAEIYLHDPSISLAEVAFLLGYSEQSPFQNAFKRRYGMAPGEFRRQQGLR